MEEADLKIFVLDVAAESGGALRVLREWRGAAEGDGNEYVFCVSVPEIEEGPNVEVIRVPWVKKSRLHRLFFDHFRLPGLIRRSGAQEVLSLQNISAPHTGLPQTVYLHQALPYCEKRYSLREAPGLWLYQHPIGRLISRSVRKADRVIVQTRWMKEALIKKEGISPEKIEIRPFEDERTDYPVFAGEKGRFFYPAEHHIYKDIPTLLKAFSTLGGGRLTLTVTRDELTPAEAAWVDGSRGSVELEGRLGFDTVLDLYSRCVLVFPSLVETFGLPLYEARRIGAPVIAADTAFAREVLEDYDRARFFPPEDAEALARLMEEYL